jgi:hypothetical protein
MWVAEIFVSVRWVQAISKDILTIDNLKNHHLSMVWSARMPGK